ncbi:MAG: SAM-dependent chlorinase/fluorinase [Deltaproteobacteria bacterium]|nr:SAM-dependent chlorinase/fluorinase [Deltaproteobacteria bacterium]
MGNIITFTTDFGLKDSYQGAMKGAALSINPAARLVDITHLVESGNILEGAFILLESYGFFPEGTIHLAVVDPGVGSQRKAVLVETERYCFVGPDNGLLFLAAGREKVKRVIHLTERPFFRKEISSTFHGRDIFAPVAAHLSLGTNPGAFGPEIEGLAPVEMPRPAKKDAIITGEVIYVDTFGNLITNIKSEDLPADAGLLDVSLNGLVIKGLTSTYSSVRKGEPLALVSSAGHIEIAVNSGPASKYFNAKVGSRVALAPSKGGKRGG